MWSALVHHPGVVVVFVLVDALVSLTWWQRYVPNHCGFTSRAPALLRRVVLFRWGTPTRPVTEDQEVSDG